MIISEIENAFTEQITNFDCTVFELEQHAQIETDSGKVVITPSGGIYLFLLRRMKKDVNNRLSCRILRNKNVGIFWISDLRQLSNAFEIFANLYGC